MNSLSDLISQYEAEAEGIAKKIAETKRRLKQEKSVAVLRRLERSLPKLNEEYYEIMRDIREMEKHGEAAE